MPRTLSLRGLGRRVRHFLDFKITEDSARHTLTRAIWRRSGRVTPSAFPGLHVLQSRVWPKNGRFSQSLSTLLVLLLEEGDPAGSSHSVLGCDRVKVDAQGLWPFGMSEPSLCGRHTHNPQDGEGGKACACCNTLCSELKGSRQRSPLHGKASAVLYCFLIVSIRNGDNTPPESKRVSSLH